MKCCNQNTSVLDRPTGERSERFGEKSNSGKYETFSGVDCLLEAVIRTDEAGEEHVMEQQLTAAAQPDVQVIDPWHAQWGDVIELVDKIGHRAEIGLDDEGWLTARKSMLVAFVEGDPAGYATVTVQPRFDKGRPAFNQGRPAVEAALSGWGVAEGFDQDAIRIKLGTAARRLADDLTTR